MSIIWGRQKVVGFVRGYALSDSFNRRCACELREPFCRREACFSIASILHSPLLRTNVSPTFECASPEATITALRQRSSATGCSRQADLSALVKCCDGARGDLIRRLAWTWYLRMWSGVHCFGTFSAWKGEVWKGLIGTFMDLHGPSWTRGDGEKGKVELCCWVRDVNSL